MYWRWPIPMAWIMQLATAALASSSTAPDSVAWISLLAGSSENMTALVLVQALSVRRFSAHSHLTLATPDVMPEARRRLAAAGSRVVDVELLKPSWRARSTWCDLDPEHGAWRRA